MSRAPESSVNPETLPTRAETLRFHNIKHHITLCNKKTPMQGSAILIFSFRKQYVAAQQAILPQPVPYFENRKFPAEMKPFLPRYETDFVALRYRAGLT
jgi:hypothetical protein